MSASTASEWLIGLVHSILSRLQALGPAEVAINAAFSGGIVLVAFALGYGLRRLLKRGVRELPPGQVAEQVRRSRAVHLGAALVRLCLMVGAAWLVLGVWGLDPLAWAQGAAAEQTLRFLGRILIIVLAGVAAFEFAGFALDRTLSHLAAASRDPRRAAQVRTLMPILKAIVRGAVLVLAAMMVLSEIGVKIGPLLAGAGVVGVAIGFGAQTLVKDFLTGLFFVIEDIVSVGDVVRIGDSKGQVESMTLRTIRLRDFDGTLHVFPYSEAQVVHNETKAFSFAVVDLMIANDADVESALQAMREVGDELAHDAAYQAKIQGNVEVLGVEGVSEHGLRLRARIRTLPREDPWVQREFYRRLKAAFDRRGVALPTASMRLIAPEGGAPTLAAAKR